MSEEMLSKIVENKERKDKTLDLSKFKMDRLPDILADSTHLESLTLHRNELEDISILKNLKRLKKLYLYKNKVSDITPIQHLEALEELHISVNPVEDFTPLKYNINLEKLYVNLDKSTMRYFKSTQIPDFSFIKNLINLIHVKLLYCKIKDLSIFDNLKKLVHLDLQGNEIEDLDLKFINQFPDLEFLSIYENKVITDKLLLSFWYDYFEPENMLEDIKRKLNTKWIVDRIEKMKHKK